MKKLIAAVLALAIAGSAWPQSKGGKRGAGKGGRESVDLYHVTTEELRADLRLTDSQAALWETYLRRIDALNEDIARDRARARTIDTNALRAFDRLVDVQRDRLTAVEDIADAGRALYRTFDAEQRAVADTRLAKLVAASDPAARAGPPPR